MVANLLVLGVLAWWLARSINRIRRYAEAMAANRVAPKPQFGDSYFYRLVNAIARRRDELNHRQHIEQYILGLTHELKTPLTAQHAALELLQDSELSPEQQQLLTRLIYNTRKQQQLIAQLLELARLENCDILPNVQNVALVALSKQAAQDCETACTPKQLRIIMDAGDEIIRQGNPILLRQAGDNLLYNAIDFARPQSEIRLSFTKTTEQLGLHIENIGEPVPDYALAKIPQRFYSLPRADGRKSSGLSFVLEIMRLHGGEIVLENRTNGVCASLLFSRP